MGFFNEAKLTNLERVQKETKAHTILIVDDEEENLINLRGIFEQDYDILEAKNGKEALDIVKNDPRPERIHLIISDQRMPELTGVEFLEQTIPIIPKTIRIVLTAYADTKSIIDAINKGGIYKFILKPFERNDMILTVQRALESYVLEQENNQLVDELRTLNTSLEEKVKDRTAELQEAYQTIKKQSDRLNKEMAVARETQKKWLPKSLPSLPNAKVFSKYEPEIQIGGDFYNIFPLDSQRYGLFVADVTGHGPSAALISFLAYGILSEAIKEGETPAQILTITNRRLEEQLPDEKFVSMFFATYNPETRYLTYANGGHPPGVLLRQQSKEIIALQHHGPPVGAFAKTQYKDQGIELIDGDRLVVHTDAINEAKNPDEKMLGLKGLYRFLENQFDASIESILENIYHYVLEYSGKASLEDDCTLVGLEVLKATPSN